jgi:hypothetical protein
MLHYLLYDLFAIFPQVCIKSERSLFINVIL